MAISDTEDQEFEIDLSRGQHAEVSFANRDASFKAVLVQFRSICLSLAR